MATLAEGHSSEFPRERSAATGNDESPRAALNGCPKSCAPAGDAGHGRKPAAFTAVAAQIRLWRAALMPCPPPQLCADGGPSLLKRLLGVPQRVPWPRLVIGADGPSRRRLRRCACGSAAASARATPQGWRRLPPSAAHASIEIPPTGPDQSASHVAMRRAPRQPKARHGGPARRQAGRVPSAKRRGAIDSSAISSMAARSGSTAANMPGGRGSSGIGLPSAVVGCGWSNQAASNRTPVRRSTRASCAGQSRLPRSAARSSSRAVGCSPLGRSSSRHSTRVSNWPKAA